MTKKIYLETFKGCARLLCFPLLMRNFQDTFATPKRSFISSFTICMTVPLRFLKTQRIFSTTYGPDTIYGYSYGHTATQIVKFGLNVQFSCRIEPN